MYSLRALSRLLATHFGIGAERGMALTIPTRVVPAIAFPSRIGEPENSTPYKHTGPSPTPPPLLLRGCAEAVPKRQGALVLPERPPARRRHPFGAGRFRQLCVRSKVSYSIWVSYSTKPPETGPGPGPRTRAPWAGAMCRS